MEMHKTVPLQPQVPSSKECSVSLVTSIAPRACQLYPMRHRDIDPRSTLTRGASPETLAVERRSHDEVGVCKSQHRSCRYPSAVRQMETRHERAASTIHGDYAADLCRAYASEIFIRAA